MLVSHLWRLTTAGKREREHNHHQHRDLSKTQVSSHGSPTRGLAIISKTIHNLLQPLSFFLIQLLLLSPCSLHSRHTGLPDGSQTSRAHSYLADIAFALGLSEKHSLVNPQVSFLHLFFLFLTTSAAYGIPWASNLIQTRAVTYATVASILDP